MAVVHLLIESVPLGLFDLLRGQIDEVEALLSILDGDGELSVWHLFG